MTTTPTPEEFLALTDPEDDTDEVTPTGVRSWPPPGFDRAFVLPPDPLQSIAESLRILAAAVEKHDADEAADDAQRERYDRLDQEYADLEDKHRSLYELLADVEKIVKPSTSKLANSVREAINRWRNPEVPVVVDEAVEPPAAVPEKIWETPAHDADVEEWRAYARSCGYVDEVTDLNQMNRSQIRTLLGIAHGDPA